MFADVIADPAAEGLSIPWWAWLAIAVAVVGATWWVISRLRGSSLAGGFHTARDVVAGHTRRLLMKRTTASPAPPPGHTPEASAAPPAPTGEAPPPPIAEQPAAKEEASRPPAAPAEEAAVDDAPPWLMKALVAIASVPTLLALPLAAWSVAQVLPVPDVVALPIGVLFDVAMVASVLIALLAPRFARPAIQVGWITAFLAAAAIVAHAGLSVAALFAAAPLVSKLLWGMVVQIRTEQAQARQREAARAAEEARVEAERLQEKAVREAELSTELTHEEQRKVADKKRLAKFKKEMAAAELELELAESEAEHKKALAKIKRLGEQQRAEDQEEADVYEQRIRLERHLRTIHGQAPRFALEPGVAEAEVVAEAAPAGITNRAGFGGGFGFTRPLDVKALTPEGASVSFEELPETHQQLVKYVKAEKTATIRGASRKLDRDPRTIRRWKDRLSELGYELPIGE
ncbi:hypothetical protein [Nocardiopsis sp. CA-288880]|uniref:hypothetical protein n=1 Tax=Nocardiopsis sp. CA-288880 TaxID=3239995 RepID=UPI003D97A14E